ncbi:hypothetical protein Tco_1116336 [Tanacetum coccineum]
MSSSTFTYTSVYTDSEPWRFYGESDEEPTDTGSPGVIVYGYDRLTMHPVAPPSLDYVPGPEHLPSPDYVPSPEHPHSPVYVPKPKYLEYLVPSGDEAPINDQPPPADALSTALSPGYVTDFDPKEYPKEDLKEDHADYPADGGAGDDEPFDDDDDDDADDEDEEASEDEDDDEEEEEHLAPSDSSAVLVVDHVPSVGDTPRSPQIIVPPSQTRLCRARKTVRPQIPISFPSEVEVDRLLALPTPPPSSLTPLSTPLPQIPSPPLPVSSPLLPLPSPLTTIPTDAKAPLGYRAAEIRMRAASPPLLLPSTSYRTDIPEAEMSPQKRACFTTPAPVFKVGEKLAVGATRQPGPTLEADLR